MANPLVTHVLWTLNRGGAERMVLDLARQLPERGFDVRVLAAGGGGEMESDFRDAGIRISINTQTVSRRSAWSFLRREIASHRPDVWHTHLTPVWAGLAARSLRLHPWVATVHGFENRLPASKRWARSLAYRAADRVVCVSEAVRSSMRFLGKDDVSVIPPGIDLKRFTPREPRMAGDVPELLTVSRLVSGKGVGVLLEALSGLLRPWKLTIVGSGSDRQTLHRQAERLGILPRIRFVGAVSDTASYYRRADVFCFPSLSEGQGMALLEAAACRVPAVASDLPAVREAFGENAVTYAVPGDVESWRHSIERILSRYPEALSQAERASRIVVERYSLTAMVEAYAKLYRELIEKKTV